MHPGTWAFVIVVGYFIGSLSPSYILGRILKHLDIREQGTKNAGVLNTYHVLGLWPAVVTAVIDLSKGLLAMYLASNFGAPPLLVHLAGCSAILGHIFPFYLLTRAGQGVATATAILIYYLVLFYINQWLPWESLILLVFYVASFVYIARKGEVVGTAVLPVLAAFVLAFSPFEQHMFFILSIIIFILIIDIINICQLKLFRRSTEKTKTEINWRLYLRPLAVLLILVYLKSDKKQALTLIGSIALFFLVLDLIRLFLKKVNIFFFKKIKDFYKSREYKKFSSITLFLFASFLTVLLFDKAIAVLAVSYIIFGDFFSKVFGIYFGRTKIFEKSLEGALAHSCACLIVGYIFLHYVAIPIPAFLVGVLVASLSETLPLGVDDNFSVALLSAATMYVFLLF